MRKLCLVTFDIHRAGEPSVSYSAGSILAYLKSKPEFGDTFDVYYKSFDLSGNPGVQFQWENELDWSQFDVIAISCYIWSHNQARDLMRWIKDEKLKAKVVAGGYQINIENPESLNAMYPNADHFILGYAEQALYEYMAGSVADGICKKPVDFNKLPSPYLLNVLPLSSEVSKIRIETKRGCPFGCTFCAQNELKQKKTKYHLEQKLIDELEYLAGKSIQRISVTDPVFNMGKTYLPYLETVNELKMTGVFNFQVRPELIDAQKNQRFLQLLSDTQSEIELGLQTFDPVVNRIIDRGNDFPKIDESLKLLQDYRIDFGISLIYGLPGQTLASFEKDIEKVKALGIKNVVAFPLMILPGTPMYEQRSEFEMEEGIIDYGFKIPHVVSSSTFTRNEWLQMHEMAQKLNPGQRLF